jgi:hypothetical protein
MWLRFFGNDFRKTEIVSRSTSQSVTKLKKVPQKFQKSSQKVSQKVSQKIQKSSQKIQKSSPKVSKSSPKMKKIRGNPANCDRPGSM